MFWVFKKKKKKKKNNANWQSAFNPQLRKKLDRLCCKPLVQGLATPKFQSDVVTWDVNKCYTMAVVEGLKNVKIPIYHLGDDMIPFNPEIHTEMVEEEEEKKEEDSKKQLKSYLFYIPTIELKPYGLLIREGIYPHILIQHLIDEKHITFDDIEYTIPCYQYVDANELVQFAEKVFDLLKDTKYAKNIINVAVGLFNTKYQSKRDQVMISTNPLFTIAYKNHIANSKIPNLKIKISGNDEFDWIRIQSQKRKNKDNGVINQYVVGAGIVRTLKMLKTKWVKGMKLIGMKTDAVYIEVPNLMQHKLAEFSPSNFCVLGYLSFDWNLVHPKHYHYVYKQLKKGGLNYDHKFPENEIITFPDCDDNEILIHNPPVQQSLELYKQYPYKIEKGKKPPKYDEHRIQALKDTIGVVDKSLIQSGLIDISETEVNKVINELNNNLNELTHKQIMDKCKLLSVLIYGTAGSGKTTLGIRIQKILIKIAKMLNKKVIISSFQRSTVASWCNRAQLKDSTYLNWDRLYGNVLKNRLMQREYVCKITPDKIFAIMIDEFFQMPERCLLDLCELLEDNPNIIVIPIGDCNQMPSIDNPKYNWMDCNVMKTFVKYKLKKNYIEGCGRFCPQVLKLVRMLERGDKKGFLRWIKKNREWIENNDVKSALEHLSHYRNPKYSDYNVDAINKIVCPKIKVGCNVICEHQFDSDGVSILVGEKYKVIAMKKNQCKLEINDCGNIKTGWFPIRYKTQDNRRIHILSPGNASTCFREQGREITCIYTIHDAHKMSIQELIVAISRGEHPTDVLFRFSRVDKILKNAKFHCAYQTQQSRSIPGCYKDYGDNDIDKPATNLFQSDMLYLVVDKNNNKYVGKHKYNPKKSLKANLNDRMTGHLSDKGKRNTDVHKMENPVIKPFYGDENDEEPYLMYGKTKDINNLEKNHIRKVLFECKQNKTKCFNKQHTKLKPVIKEKQMKQLNVINDEIERMLNQYRITTEATPTKKDKNKTTYLLNNKEIAKRLGLKNRRVTKRKFEEIIKIKNKFIADVCSITYQEVDQQREQILKKSPNPQPDGSYI